MQDRPADQRRLYQQVADRIRQLIDAGDFAPGSRLPAERDLALQLTVSRPSLREALIALEIDGTVEIRGGSGVYVATERLRPAPGTLQMGESPSELMQARAVIEASAALMAASRMTDETLAMLRETLDAMQAEIEHQRSPLEQDRAFHLAIAAQAGNSVISGIVANLFDERHSPISKRLQDRTGSPETWAAALREHRAILDALERRDASLAQAQMHAHLEASRRRWTGD